MVRRFRMVAVLIGIVAASAVGCRGKLLAHSGEDPVYPLRGLHAAVPCAACHGAGKPQQLPTACVDCHAADRPEGHYPAYFGCYECHIEDGWDVIINPDFTVPEPPDPGFPHDTLPETQLCWECHEAERKDPGHYADSTSSVVPDPVRSQDCGGCHTATAWAWEPIEHPVRLPHGVEIGDQACRPRPEGAWSTGCIGCHPVSTDTFACFTCHNEDESPGELAHNGSYQENACLTCHVDGEPDNCLEE